MKRYANLTSEDRGRIIKAFRDAMERGATDEKHAMAIATKEAFDLSDKAWNGKTGDDCFASTCAVLVMTNEVGVHQSAQSKTKTPIENVI
jgi:hypothetical protein